MYSPTLGRWMQQDPAGYVDGASLYAALKSRPEATLDPYGLETGPVSPVNPPYVPSIPPEIAWDLQAIADFLQDVWIGGGSSAEQAEAWARDYMMEQYMWVGYEQHRRRPAAPPPTTGPTIADPTLRGLPEGQRRLWRSEVVNLSRKCVIIAYSDKNDKFHYFLLKPNERTRPDFDEGDYVYHDGKWYKVGGLMEATVIGNANPHARPTGGPLRWLPTAGTPVLLPIRGTQAALPKEIWSEDNWWPQLAAAPALGLALDFCECNNVADRDVRATMDRILGNTGPYPTKENIGK